MVNVRTVLQRLTFRYLCREELEKTHEVLIRDLRHNDPVHPYPRAYTDSPHSSYRPDSTNNPSSNSRPPPTGPRAHKRPRLLEPQPSPPARPVAPLPPKPQTQNHSHHHHSHTHHSYPPLRDQGRHSNSVQDKDASRHNKSTNPNINASNPPHLNSKMQLDGANSSRPASPSSVRERERARERERNNKERERRDRESRDNNTNTTNVPLPSNPLSSSGNTTSRRNGNYSSPSSRPSGGGGAGPGRRVSTNTNSAGGPHSQSSDRTLQQRMGL